MTKKGLNLLGQLLMILATVVWGTSFFILKETIETVPTFFVLCLRFLPSGLILLLLFCKKTFKMGKGTLLRGALLGVILAGAYITQTHGLALTTPSRNAFVTSCYVVMVPFLTWFFFKKPPKNYNIISAITCLIGIGFVSFSSGFGDAKTTALIGDGLTFICAIFYAFQIFLINVFQNKNDDAICLLSIELLTVGIICGLFSLIVEVPAQASVGNLQAFILNGEQILKIGYLTIICTLMAQGCQMFGQRFTTANQASIILSLESVFGTLFSVILGGESLTVLMVVGFIIVFISVLYNELEIDVFKLLSGKKSIEAVENMANTSQETTKTETNKE